MAFSASAVHPILVLPKSAGSPVERGRLADSALREHFAMCTGITRNAAFGNVATCSKLIKGDARPWRARDQAFDGTRPVKDG